MIDYISRADAMGAVQDHFNDNGFKGYDDGQKMMDRIKALPSAELPKGELISRADAIAYIDRVINSGLGRNKSLDYIRKYISALPSADAVSREDYEDIIKDYRKQYENMNNEIADLEAKLANCVEVDRTSEWVAVRREEYEDLIADAEPKWNCTANFVAEQLDRLRNMTDEERWEFFKKFFEIKGGDDE